MDDVFDALRDAAPDAFEGEPVAFAYLFGSHAAGTATDRSDVDVAIHLTTGSVEDPLDVRLRLAGRLERAIGSGPVEVVVLDAAPISLAGRVRQHGRPFHVADEITHVRWASLVSRMFHDFRVHEERGARERLARLAEGP